MKLVNSQTSQQPCLEGGLVGFDTVRTRRFGQEARNIILFETSRPVLGPSHPLLLNWYRRYFVGVKWPEHEVNHSPASSVEVKNEWSYTSASPHAFMLWAEVALAFISFKRFCKIAKSGY
jgi:hypothetical protein